MWTARGAWLAGMAALLLMSACGEDGGTAGSAGDGGAGASTSSGGAGGGGITPGMPAAGWEQAYSGDGVGIGCGQSLADMQAAGAPSLAFGDTTIVVGFEQVSGNNQDPVVARFDGDTLTYCEHHEDGGPDGRALGLTWDGGAEAYVVYTVVGGGSGLESWAADGWLPSYGNGGGPKVSFLGRLDAASGDLTAGTFILAKKMDGSTNTHRPAAAPVKLATGGVEFLGESAFQPMNPDGTIMDCTDYPFSTRYRFDDALGELTCSSSTNCTGEAPCE